MPRAGKQYERMRSISEEYDTTEYLITNKETKVFSGNALDLITLIYKAEQVPLRVRLYAASKVVESEFEKLRVEPPKEEEDPEERHRETHEVLEYFAEYAIHETISRLHGHAKFQSGCPAWIGELVDKIVAEGLPVTLAAEIAPPESPPPPRKERFYGC
jgi:hypothetical protein